MKILHLLENTSMAFVLVCLVILYSVSYLTYQNYGYWPSYGHPQAWSSEPAQDFYSPLFLMFLISLALSLIGIAVQTVKAGVIAFHPVKGINYLKITVFTAVYLLFILDPCGFLYWYMD